MGFQIQQTRKMMFASAAQARSDTLIGLMASLEDEDFSQFWDSVREKAMEDLKGPEQTRISAFLARMLQSSFNSYYQRKLGVLDPDQAMMIDRMPLFSQGIGRSYWKARRASENLPEDFIEHVDRVIEHGFKHQKYER